MGSEGFMGFVSQGIIGWEGCERVRDRMSLRFSFPLPLGGFVSESMLTFDAMGGASLPCFIGVLYRQRGD